MPVLILCDIPCEKVVSIRKYVWILVMQRMQSMQAAIIFKICYRSVSENASLKILANAIIEKHRTVKFGKDAGLKPMDELIFVSAQA